MAVKLANIANLKPPIDALSSELLTAIVLVLSHVDDLPPKGRARFLRMIADMIPQPTTRSVLEAIALARRSIPMGNPCCT